MTPKQRLEIYEIGLTEFLLAEKGLDYIGDNSDFISGRYFSLCKYLEDRFSAPLDTLVELLKTEPKYSGAYWFSFDNISARIKCLQKAIEITENKIKNQEKSFAK